MGTNNKALRFVLKIIQANTSSDQNTNRHVLPAAEAVLMSFRFKTQLEFNKI